MKLKHITRQLLISKLTTTTSKFPFLLDTNSLNDIVGDAIQTLSISVSQPRLLLIEPAGSKKILLPELCEDVVNVYFPDDSFNTSKFLGDIGYLAMSGAVGGSAYSADFDSIGMYLILRDTIQTIKRYTGSEPFWQYNAPYLYLNDVFDHVAVEFLPYLNGNDDGWYVYDNEHSFLNEIIYIRANLKNSEALVSAGYLGVGTEYQAVLNYWADKEKARLDSFLQNESFMFYGG